MNGKSWDERICSTKKLKLIVNTVFIFGELELFTGTNFKSTIKMRTIRESYVIVILFSIKGNR